MQQPQRPSLTTAHIAHGAERLVSSGARTGCPWLTSPSLRWQVLGKRALSVGPYRAAAHSTFHTSTLLSGTCLSPTRSQTCSWSPGGELLAVGGHDRHVVLLNAVTWQPLMEGQHGERVGAPASVVVYREVGAWKGRRWSGRGGGVGGVWLCAEAGRGKSG